METSPQEKTLDSLKSWSTWLVAIDTGAIALIGTFDKWQHPASKILGAVSGIFFLVSLIVASFLVGSVPVFLQLVLSSELKDSSQVRAKGKENIYEFEYGPFTLRRYAEMQHYSFIAAAILVTTAVIVQLCVPVK